MSFFSGLDTLSSALAAQRIRMNTHASNLANAQTTRTAEGGPYRRRSVVFRAAPKNDGIDFASFDSELAGASSAVEVADVAVDQAPPRRVYDPGHPDANKEGYVAMPNINILDEMVNMMAASRSYEAGTTAIQSVLEMAAGALSIGK